MGFILHPCIAGHFLTPQASTNCDVIALALAPQWLPSPIQEMRDSFEAVYFGQAEGWGRRWWFWGALPNGVWLGAAFSGE